MEFRRIKETETKTDYIDYLMKALEREKPFDYCGEKRNEALLNYKKEIYKEAVNIYQDLEVKSTQNEVEIVQEQKVSEVASFKEEISTLASSELLDEKDLLDDFENVQVICKKKFSFQLPKLSKIFSLRKTKYLEEDEMLTEMDSVLSDTVSKEVEVLIEEETEEELVESADFEETEGVIEDTLLEEAEILVEEETKEELVENTDLEEEEEVVDITIPEKSEILVEETKEDLVEIVDFKEAEEVTKVTFSEESEVLVEEVEEELVESADFEEIEEVKETTLSEEDMDDETIMETIESLQSFLMSIMPVPGVKESIEAYFEQAKQTGNEDMLPQIDLTVPEETLQKQLVKLQNYIEVIWQIPGVEESVEVYKMFHTVSEEPSEDWLNDESFQKSI